MPSTPKETSTTSTTKVELPAWVDQGGQDNYALAQKIAETPYQPYTQPLVAGMTNGYRDNAYDNARGAVDSTVGGTNTSARYLRGMQSPTDIGLNGYSPSMVGADTAGTGTVTAGSVGLNGYTPSTVNASTVGLNGYTPSMVKAQQVANPNQVANISAANISDADIQKYFNPYENQVVAGAQDAGQKSIAASQRANSDAAIAAGAFGGSRHGVTEGVTAAEGAQNIANTVGSIRAAGFGTALSAAQSDAARTDAVSTQNQNTQMSFQDLLAKVGMSNQSANLSADQGNQNALADRAKMQLSADQGNQSSGLSAQIANQGALADRAKMQLSADQGNQSSGLSASTSNADNALRASLANQSANLSAATANQGALADRAKMQLAAQQSNQSAQGQYNSALLGAAGQSTANGNARAAAQSSLASMYGNDAILSQQTDQSGLNAAYQQFQQQQDYPTEQLNLRLAALGMTPYGKTTSSSGTSTETGGDNPFLTAIGGLSSMKGLFGFSDPKLKKNVKTEGKGPNGLTVKSFDYRQDKGVPLPKGRQIGYMADEVEKKMPGAVRRVPIGNGKTAKQVDYAKTGRPGVFGFAKHKAA